MKLKFLFLILILSDTTKASYSSNDVLYIEEDERPKVRWIVDENNNSEEEEINENRLRKKREIKNDSGTSSRLFFQVEPSLCRDKLKRLCAVFNKEMDDLFFLECIQTFKVSELGYKGEGLFLIHIAYCISLIIKYYIAV